MRYEILDAEGQVINTILADAEFVEKHYAGRYRVAEAPVVVVPEAAPERRLTKLQFRSRFTLTEKVALYTAAESQVLIRIFLDDVNAAEYIDLNDPVTVAGVEALESYGLIAEGRAQEILT